MRWRSDRQPATRSRVRRLKAVKPAAAQRSRCSPCCATPHDPTTGRLPMTHQGWDLNRPGFSGGAVPLVAWGRVTGISCHGGWVLELYRGQHAQVSCGGAGVVEDLQVRAIFNASSKPARTGSGRRPARRHRPAGPARTGPDRPPAQHCARHGSSRPAQSCAQECDSVCLSEPAWPSSSPLARVIIERLVLPKGRWPLRRR